jgi:poly(hydroxyalkanoate) depolymerase family esterase
MSRRTPLFSLSALTRAYQRQLGALARTAATRPPARRKAAARPAPLPASGGAWLRGLGAGPAGVRRYQLYVPPGPPLRPGETLPLLVLLHGCGQTGGDLAAVSRMHRLAQRERFLVLCPEQDRGANVHGCWNWFERRSGKAAAEAATLLALVDRVASRQPVDRARVAIAGLSAGASMAALVAALYPARFCAVAMHSGVAPGAAESAASAMAAMHGRRAGQLPHALAPAAPPALALPPLLIVHGDADGVVALQSARAAAQLWGEALGARPGAVRRLQRGKRHATRRTEYRLRGRTVVALHEVEGLAHAWSGGAARRAYSDPAGPDASALIWAFVRRQFAPRPGTP